MSDSSQHWPENSGVSGNTALDRPGWLPEGWTVEIKTRTAGSTAGRKDKVAGNGDISFRSVRFRV